MPLGKVVCHGHVRVACFPREQHVHEDVDMAHGIKRESLLTYDDPYRT
jgi:hypothetical protein